MPLLRNDVYNIGDASSHLKNFNYILEGNYFKINYPLLPSLLIKLFTIIFNDDYLGIIFLSPFLYTIIVFLFYLTLKKLFFDSFISLIFLPLIAFSPHFNSLIANGLISRLLVILFISYFIYILLIFSMEINQGIDNNSKVIILSLIGILGSHFLGYLIHSIAIISIIILQIILKRKTLYYSLIKMHIYSLIGGFFIIPQYINVLLDIKFTNTDKDIIILSDINKFNIIWETYKYLYLPAFNIYIIISIIAFIGLILFLFIKNDLFHNYLFFYVLASLISLMTPTYWDKPASPLILMAYPIILSGSYILYYLFKYLLSINRFNINCNKKLLISVILFLLINPIFYINSESFINRYKSQVEYYETIGNEEIDSFEWIKDNIKKESKIITIGRVRRSVEPFTHINQIQSVDTIWWLSKDLIKEKERNQGFKASLILSGKYNIENGMVLITDTGEDNDVASPIVSINIGEYQSILYISDSLTHIKYKYNNSYNTINLSNFIKYYKINNSSINIIYEGKLMNITKIFSLKKSLSKVYLNYNISVKDINVVITDFILTFTSEAYITNIKSINDSDNLLEISQMIPKFNKYIVTNISFNSSEVNSNKLLEFNTEQFTLRYSGLQINKNIYYEFTIVPTTYTISHIEPILYDSNKLIEELNANYIYVSSRNWPDTYYLKKIYLKKSELFELLYENKYVCIFKIV